MHIALTSVTILSRTVYIQKSYKLSLKLVFELKLICTFDGWGMPVRLIQIARIPHLLFSFFKVLWKTKTTHFLSVCLLHPFLQKQLPPLTRNLVEMWESPYMPWVTLRLRTEHTCKRGGSERSQLVRRRYQFWHWLQS